MSIKRVVSLLSVAIFAVALLGTIINISVANIAFAQELSDEEVAKIKEEILSYAAETREDDPLIEVESNVFIKESNYRGITINEQTYYYSLFPHMSYDPVTRGEIDRRDVNIVYETSDTEIPVIIYTKRQ